MRNSNSSSRWILMYRGVTTVVLLGSLALQVSGQTERPTQRFQPKDVARLRSVVECQISPDGRSMAYGLSVQRQPLTEDDGPPWVELHVVDLAGKSRPFITGKVNISGIQWTPDGTRIAFVAKRGDDKQSSLYLIPVDGGESKRVLEHATGIGGVAFSKDGSKVAFLATDEKPKEHKEVEEKGFNQEIYEEDWRPTRVWIASLDGTDPAKSLSLPGSASQVAWHPSGEQLVVVLAPTPSVDDSYMYQRVRIVDAATGRVLEEIKNPGKLGHVAWNPSGSHLAMISGADLHDPGEGRLLVTTVPAAGDLRDLIPDLQGHVTSFAWEDDSSIAWLADEGEWSAAGSVTLDGTVSRRIEGPGPILSFLSLSSDGNTSGLIGHTPESPMEAYVIRPEQSSVERLTQSNSWLSSMQFAEQEPIQWNARDGLQLGGVLVKPLNYVAGRRYPLIMVVHGGPEAHVSNGWVTSYSNPGQMGAARGFVVFYPNYRGSTGRGVEFSKMGQGDAAGKEFDDLVDAIDHLDAMGLIDPKKVGITGGSYGGYASAWGSTYYSDRYAASVMFVGISDNISKVGTTDIPEEMFLVHHLKRLWDDWTYFAERSPIHYVQRNKTPTLILHGKQDPRVHPSQSLELFRHLKTLNQAPVRLVLYEGEGHGNRKAAARFDYSLRLLQWMEHYLQGPGGPAPAYELNYQAALK